MPENHSPRFFARQLLKLPRYRFTDPSKPLDPANFARLNRYISIRRLSAFGDHHDRIWLALFMSSLQVGSELLNVIGDFRNQDRVRATRDSGVEGNPPYVASHHFDHDDALVRQR